MRKHTTKIFAMLVLIALTVTALASCGIMIPGEYRFGLATVETDDSQIAAAVILDSSDRIALVRIDEIAKGANKSKGDLGASYGMVTYGGASAEWYQQIDHLEKTLIGKTMEEALTLTSDDADIASGCTIYIGNYLTAVGKACTKAQDAEAFSSTVDHIALTLTIHAGKAGAEGEYTVAVMATALDRGYVKAKDSAFFGAIPTGHKLGLATLDVDGDSPTQVAAAVLVDDDGRIVLVRIDEFEFSKGQSKKEQGDAYGMATYNPYALAEWYEQVGHLESGLIGKNKDEVAGLTGEEADIKAGCTIEIDNLKLAVTKAMDNAISAKSFSAISKNVSLDLTFSTDEDGAYATAKASVKGVKVVEKSSNAEDLRFGFASVKTDEGKVGAIVAINEDDQVVLVKIDEIANGETQSKKEKGDSYGMLTNSPYYGSSLAEWYAQIAYLENSLVGKTALEIAGLKNEKDADLVTGCTIKIGNYSLAVINAMESAKSNGAINAKAANVQLDLTLEAGENNAFTAKANATYKDSKVFEASDAREAEELKLGYATIDSAKGQVVAAVVIDASGKVVAVKIDEIDLSKGVIESKKAQGDAYGMLSDWGSKLAEWDDQIAHLERTMIGKTLDEISGVTADDADVAAGCTVYIGNYASAVASAITGAASSEAFTASRSDIAIILELSASNTAPDYVISADITVDHNGTVVASAEKETPVTVSAS